VGFLKSYTIPLAFAVFIFIFKEVMEDLNRHVADTQINQKYYKRLDTHTGRVNLIRSQKISQGDII